MERRKKDTREKEEYTESDYEPVHPEDATPTKISWEIK